jgi:hypothetical protein
MSRSPAFRTVLALGVKEEHSVETSWWRSTVSALRGRAVQLAQKAMLHMHTALALSGDMR